MTFLFLAAIVLWFMLAFVNWMKKTDFATLRKLFMTLSFVVLVFWALALLVAGRLLILLLLATIGVILFFLLRFLLSSIYRLMNMNVYQARKILGLEDEVTKESIEKSYQSMLRKNAIFTSRISFFSYKSLFARYKIAKAKRVLLKGLEK